MEAGTITAFLAIGAVIFIGFFGNAIFNKYRIPDVLILVFLGMLIGPDILGERFGLITYETLGNIDEFRDILLSAALVIILFDGGLTLDIRSVIESMRLSAFMSILTFVLEMLAVAAALHFIMGMDLLLAVTLGSIVGGTSGAIVIPIANKLRIKPRTKAIMIMESAVTDVLVVVGALTLILVVQLGEFNLVRVTEDLIIKFLIGGAVGFLAGIAWLFALQKLHNQPLSYMITIAALFLVAGLVETIGSSGAVAALAFGLSLGNRQFVRRWLTSVSLRMGTDGHIQQFHFEITFFVRTFFFVYLGLLFRFDTFTEIHLITGILLISVIALVRWFTSMATWKIGGLEMEDALALWGLMPRGLAAAVLATLPAVALAGVAVWEADSGLPSLFLNVTLIVILGTTVLATILSAVTERVIDRRHRQVSRLKMDQDDVESI
ncbi:MAG TPA: cation:proton antiporter [Thermoplasmata archaeon]